MMVLRRGEQGQTLLLLLIIAAILVPLGTGFVSSMFLQQRLATERYRAGAALYLAEAGIEKTLSYLEGEAPDGSRDASWRPRGYSEELRAGALRGRFIVDVADDREGRVSIVSWGEVGRSRRGIRSVAKIAPGALDYALFAGGLLAIEGDQALLSLEEVRDRCVPGIMVASNTEIWFRTPGSQVKFLPCGQNQPVLRVGLPDPLRLTVGDTHGAARFLGLRTFGVHAGDLEVVTIAAEMLPVLDGQALPGRAKRNEANAALNHAAGEAADRPQLRDKRDSLYTAEEFGLVMRHLRGKSAFMLGPVYVTGRTIVPADVLLTIADGFLAAEGGLTVEAGGRLTVRHGLNARLLPGVVTVGAGAPLIVGEGASVDVEGVVFAGGLVDLREASSLHIQGAVIAAAPEFSLRANNATLSIRYNPIAPGTVGLLARGGRRRIFSLTWHEVR